LTESKRGHRCGFDDTPFAATSGGENRMMRRYKRSATPTAETPAKSAPSSIRGPWNANVRSRYVELVLVVDHQVSVLLISCGRNLRIMLKKGSITS
jgi:hypothetical protein